MATKLLRISNFIVPSQRATSILSPQSQRHFTSSIALRVTVDEDFIRKIAQAEARLTQSSDPAERGPTAMATKHLNQELTRKAMRDIYKGERNLTQKPIAKGGPVAVAQSIFRIASEKSRSGQLDGATISKITEKEKELTGQDEPVKGGPTARAQQHAGEPITSQSLHDITEGEKMVTGGERVKGGPTSTAQSELSKSRT